MATKSKTKLKCVTNPKTILKSLVEAKIALNSFSEQAVAAVNEDEPGGAAAKKSLKFALDYLERGTVTLDTRTALHHAKSLKLVESLSPCTPEEIGSTTWVKKVNALVVIKNERNIDDLTADVKLLEHLAKHNKLTVLVHDLILVSLWRNEILPGLLELSKKRAAKGKKELDIAAHTTIRSVYAQLLYCFDIIAAASASECPALMLRFGTDWHDLIDFCVHELRYFINNKPDSAPSDLNGEHERIPSYNRTCSDALQMLTFLSKLLRISILMLAKPPKEKDVMVKMIHPETKLLVTLADLILIRPWCYNSNGDYAKSYKVSKQTGENPNSCRMKKSLLDPIESATWHWIHTIVDFAETISVPLQVTQECYDKLLLLRGPVSRTRLVNKMPETLKIKQFLDKLASTPYTPPGPCIPVPPSPYYVNIRAELEQKKDQILAIHSAMGTFEQESLADVSRKFNRDNKSVTSTCDMNNCCFHCAKPDAQERCSRCRYARYCDRKCQKKDWWKHKSICSPPNNDTSSTSKIPDHAQKQLMNFLVKH